jgi:hypothetical protein
MKILFDDFVGSNDAKELFNLVTMDAAKKWHLAYRTDEPGGEDKDIVLDKIEESYQFVMAPEPWDPAYQKAVAIFEKAVRESGVLYSKILRLKFNILPRGIDSTKYHTPHVDQDRPHKVFLYYVNDSDGDTFFFNERFGQSVNEFTVESQVTPKMGRAVFFDGDIYHASSSPTQSKMRCILNIDFE